MFQITNLFLIFLFQLDMKRYSIKKLKTIAKKYFTVPSEYIAYLIRNMIMNIPLATWPTADLTVLAGQEMSERYQVFEWDFVHYIYHLKLVMKVKTALA